MEYATHAEARAANWHSRRHETAEAARISREAYKRQNGPAGKRRGKRSVSKLAREKYGK